MSASTLAPAPALQAAAPAVTRPSFVGIVRGEFLKVSRQWIVWIMAVLLAGVIFLPYLVTFTNDSLKARITAAPLQFMYRELGTDLLVMRVFSGIFLIIVTSRLIGMEYSGGTIRVLLARGVGRLQLLGAKLFTVAGVALAILAGGLVLNAIFTTGGLLLLTGNLDAYKALNSGFWQDTWLFVVTVMISMAVTILMATAVTVVGRSLAFGTSASLVWFPIDNIGVIFFYLAFKLTGSTFWTLATGDLLGPNINIMSDMLLPQRAANAMLGRAFSAPLVPVTGGHTLLITGIYAAIFIVVAVVLTWKRDVKE